MNQKIEENRKKVCRFCKHNNYEGRHASHLKSKHDDIIKKRKFIRNMSNHLSAEELQKVVDFVKGLKDNE